MKAQSRRKRIMREMLAIAVPIAVFGLMVFAHSMQHVEAMNSLVSIQRADDRVKTSAPLGSDKLVYLEVRDLGYSITLKLAQRPLALGSDGCNYDLFGADKTALFLWGGHSLTRPFIINPHTKIALNVSRSTTVFNEPLYPDLIEQLPWRHITTGAQFLTYEGPAPKQAWLNHEFAVSHIAADGTVTITAGKKRILLRPGGEVKIERSVDLWRSTVTIRHRGLFAKNKVRQSKWLRVETNLQ